MMYLVFMPVLALMELGLTFFFVFDILTGTGTNFILGTILGAELLIIALAMIFYLLAMIHPRKVVEDRGEGLLW
jgi:hypothetical protein